MTPMTPHITPPVAAYAGATSARHRGQAPRVVLVPAGAVEQHGPHLLPLGVDTWIATELCHRVSSHFPTTAVAEPISYGCSWHHTSFAGTVSLRTSTFIALLTDVCTALHADGNRGLIVNGHGGNRGPIQTAAADLASHGVATWSVSYFELLADVVARAFDEPRAAGHAGAMETSIMMHLWPDLIDTDAIPPGPTPPGWPDQHLFHSDPVRTVRPFEQINPTGVIGQPDLARVDAGSELVEVATERLGQIVESILAQPAVQGDG